MGSYTSGPFNRGGNDTGNWNPGSPLVSGRVSIVPHIDIPLSTGYMSFKLFLAGFTTDESSEDSFNARLSFDGVTFATDSNYVTKFSAAQAGQASIIVSGGTDTSFDVFDGYPSSSFSPGWSMSGEINIFPGSATLYPTMHWRGTATLADASMTDFSGSGIYVGRVGLAKAIRLSTSFASGFNTSGAYALYGVPSP